MKAYVTESDDLKQINTSTIFDQAAQDAYFFHNTNKDFMNKTFLLIMRYKQESIYNLH